LVFIYSILRNRFGFKRDWPLGKSNDAYGGLLSAGDSPWADGASVRRGGVSPPRKGRRLPHPDEAGESYAIRGAIFEVYKTLGSGFLEDVYQLALEEELRLRNIPFEAKKPLHIMYKGKDCGLYNNSAPALRPAPKV